MKEEVSIVTRATLCAGIPATNLTLYHRMRFSVGDPSALIEVEGKGGSGGRSLILRDIEVERAKKHARADAVYCPKDFEPVGGLSGDRETATAQSVAEFFRREGVKEVVADRTLPMIYAHFIEAAGIGVVCDPEMWIAERRAKDEAEIKALRRCQRVTEEAVAMACGMVARADAGAGGVLMRDGSALTSERVREAIDVHLLRQGFANGPCIVAGGPEGADCHNRGSGELRTGETVIIDVFPMDRETKYNGDCTRTVVHGDVPDEVAKAHDTVVRAKASAIDATRAGATGEDVHRATMGVIEGAGYGMGMGETPDVRMVHGTGHGVGLEVHEPPLLDLGGPELVVGDCLTIEPGLYCPRWGGIRVEDMVIVTDDGCENFNEVGEGLEWV